MHVACINIRREKNQSLEVHPAHIARPDILSINQIAHITIYLRWYLGSKDKTYIG